MTAQEFQGDGVLLFRDTGLKPLSPGWMKVFMQPVYSEPTPIAYESFTVLEPNKFMYSMVVSESLGANLPEFSLQISGTYGTLFIYLLRWHSGANTYITVPDDDGIHYTLYTAGNPE